MDVISILDRECSGKNSCEYKVGDELYETKPCPQGMAARNSYLEVSHKCIKGKYKICYIVRSLATLKCVSDIILICHD